MIRTILVLALTGALGACAGASSSANSAPGRKAADDAPRPVSAYVDSAALFEALRTAPAVPAELTLKPLFSVSYDSTGALTEVKPISTRLIPAEWGRTMAGILRTHARPRISTSRATMEVIWLVSGSEPRVSALVGSVERRPALLNGGIISRELNGVSQRLGSTNPGLAGRTMTAQVRLNVTSEGVVERVRVVRSSYDGQVDEAIIEVARKMVFTPAMVDGYYVPVMVEIPISIQFQN